MGKLPFKKIPLPFGFIFFYGVANDRNGGDNLYRYIAIQKHGVRKMCISLGKYNP